MRALIVSPVIVAAFVWLTSADGFLGDGRSDWFNASDLPEMDPQFGSAIETAPAPPHKPAGEAEMVYARGGLVNLRAGPGLDYRMLTVVAHGEPLKVTGPPVDGWLPVCECETLTPAWIAAGNFTTAPPH